MSGGVRVAIAGAGGFTPPEPPVEYFRQDEEAGKHPRPFPMFRLDENIPAGGSSTGHRRSGRDGGRHGHD